MHEELQDKKVHKIEKIEKLDTTAQIEQIQNKEEIQVSKTKFDTAVEKADANWQEKSIKAEVVAINDEKRPSPIVELGMSEKKILRLEPASATQVTEQADKLRTSVQGEISRLESVVKQNPDIKLSPVVEGPLSEKLVHVDASLRSALGIVGTEVKAQPVSTTPADHPLVKFLNFLTHGDRQLATVVSEVKDIQNIAPEKLTASKLLAVQIKLGFVQQELEFFTSVLNKALESTKTIMNIQV